MLSTTSTNNQKCNIALLFNALLTNTQGELLDSSAVSLVLEKSSAYSTPL
jgi:hypothetical protein